MNCRANKPKVEPKPKKNCLVIKLKVETKPKRTVEILNGKPNRNRKQPLRN